MPRRARPRMPPGPSTRPRPGRQALASRRPASRGAASRPHVAGFEALRDLHADPDPTTATSSRGADGSRPGAVDCGPAGMTDTLMGLMSCASDPWRIADCIGTRTTPWAEPEYGVYVLLCSFISDWPPVRPPVRTLPASAGAGAYLSSCSCQAVTTAAPAHGTRPGWYGWAHPSGRGPPRDPRGWGLPPPRDPVTEGRPGVPSVARWIIVAPVRYDRGQDHARARGPTLRRRRRVPVEAHGPGGGAIDPPSGGRPCPPPLDPSDPAAYPRVGAR